MKKKYLIIILILMVTANACQDDLNQVPISSPSAANFFRNTTDFQQAVNGIYNALGSNPVTVNGYAIRRFELSEIRSDNLNVNGVGAGGGVRDFHGINNFVKTLATNSYMNEAWGANYIGIARCNIVLDNLKKTNVITDPVLKAQFEGEAKFLRAFFYFDLVRWFGRVPIVDHIVTPDESLTIGRAPVSDVYNLIIADLTTAIANLPTSFTANGDKSRATSLAAKALLGTVYLTRTGPTYGIDGPGMATNEYALAVSNFNDVIASGKFSFVATYPSIFSWTNEGNQDIVFDIAAIKSGTGDVGTGTRFPSEITDANFASGQGITFAGGALDVKMVSPDMNNSFEVGDTRKTFSILPQYTYSGGTVVKPTYIKFWDKTQAGVDRFNWGLNYPVIRYTDILMMKAEAILRGGVGANGTQADVDAIMLQVRTRAGLGAVVITNTTLAQLLTERRHEFMAEGLRWHDLVRNGTVITTMNAWKAVDDAGINAIQAITANDILYAVPTNQLSVKVGLYDQNPGY